MKAVVKLALAKELEAHMTHKVGINALMKMSKKEFLKLWHDYCAFCEADDELGDCTP